MMWLVAVPAGALMIFLFLVSPRLAGKRERAGRLARGPYAHRGLHGEGIPENSLPAFERAAQKGFGIEMDIRLTRDGHLVVHHDESAKRTCGVDRRIGDMTLEEVRSCRLTGSDAGIPLLEEVLEKVGPSGAPLILEMKSDAGSRRRLPALLCRCMARYPGAWSVESFDPRMLRWFRKNAPEVIRGQLAWDPAKAAGERRRGIRCWCGARLLMNFLSRPDFIAYDYRTEGNRAFRLFQAIFQTPLAAWTVTTRAEMDRLRRRYEIQIFEGFIPSAGLNTVTQEEKETESNERNA